MNFSRRVGTDYHSFLLRFWRDGPTGSWRASVHSASTDIRLNFSDTEQLFAFLQSCMDDASDANSEVDVGPSI